MYSVPLMIFVGPRASGKTLAVARMIRFLQMQGYAILPYQYFCAFSYRWHQGLSPTMKDLAYRRNTPSGPADMNSQIWVISNGDSQTVCFLLDAPGDCYFNRDDPHAPLPPYLSSLLASYDKKVWVLFVEQDWGTNQRDRDLYAQKIDEMRALISPNDKVVFLFNKTDRHHEQYDKYGRPKKQLFFKKIRAQYPGIFDKFKRSGLMALLYGKYNFKAVMFSSGTFCRTNDGREAWTQSHDNYCEDLWKAINHR